jgi:hypothetical protein
VIEDATLTTGSLSDGVILWELLHVVSEKKLPLINKRPYVKIQQINNLLVCLKFLEEEGVRLFGIGPEGTAKSFSSFDSASQFPTRCHLDCSVQIL